MDLYCPRCGEPYELDYVQHDMTVMERARFKGGKGCPSCYGKPIELKQSDRAVAAGIVMELLGDDLDGAAATLEDFGF